MGDDVEVCGGCMSSGGLTINHQYAPTPTATITARNPTHLHRLRPFWFRMNECGGFMSLIPRGSMSVQRLTNHLFNLGYGNFVVGCLAVQVQLVLLQVEYIVEHGQKIHLPDPIPSH